MVYLSTAPPPQPSRVPHLAEMRLWRAEAAAESAAGAVHRLKMLRRPSTAAVDMPKNFLRRMRTESSLAVPPHQRSPATRAGARKRGNPAMRAQDSSTTVLALSRSQVPEFPRDYPSSASYLYRALEDRLELPLQERPPRPTVTERTLQLASMSSPSSTFQRVASPERKGSPDDRPSTAPTVGAGRSRRSSPSPQRPSPQSHASPPRAPPSLHGSQASLSSRLELSSQLGDALRRHDSGGALQCVDGLLSLLRADTPASAGAAYARHENVEALLRLQARLHAAQGEREHAVRAAGAALQLAARTAPDPSLSREMFDELQHEVYLHEMYRLGMTEAAIRQRARMGDTSSPQEPPPSMTTDWALLEQMWHVRQTRLYFDVPIKVAHTPTRAAAAAARRHSGSTKRLAAGPAARCTPGLASMPPPLEQQQQRGGASSPPAAAAAAGRPATAVVQEKQRPKKALRFETRSAFTDRLHARASVDL